MKKFMTGNLSWSRLDMARYIVQDIKRLNSPADKDDKMVKKFALYPYDTLVTFVQAALVSIDERMNINNI